VGTPQLYVVPAGIILPPTVVYEKGEPLQAVIGFAVMEGVGFTVIVTVNGVPGQAPASPEVGVTV
jgi:hypothetical protein